MRPLIAEEGRSTRDTSREDEVWRGPGSLVTVAGGKLTTYRRMAERVIDELRDILGSPPTDEDRTLEVLLPGTPAEPESFRRDRRALLVEAGVDGGTADRLGWLYGRQIDALLDLPPTPRG